jgi:hypothetical protein
MWPRRLVFLLVATLVLWYLGHVALNALLMAAAPDLSAGGARAADLALVPLCTLVAWLLLRRIEAAS